MAPWLQEAVILTPPGAILITHAQVRTRPRYRRKRYVRRRRRPYGRRRFRRRRHFRGPNKKYYFRFRRQFQVTFKKRTDTNIVWGSDYLTFTLYDFVSADGLFPGPGKTPAQLPFEDYQIPLVKVTMRPAGENVLVAQGTGHVVAIQDPSIKKWKLETVTQDPLANFDGAKKYNATFGFSKLLRPKPMIVVGELQAQSDRAEVFMNRNKDVWIPLQAPSNSNYMGQKVEHFGLAYSYPKPIGSDYDMICEVTLYIRFRQFAALQPIHQ